MHGISRGYLLKYVYIPLVFIIMVYMLVSPAFASFRRAPELRAYSLQGEVQEIPNSNTPTLVFFLSPDCLTCLADLVDLHSLKTEHDVEVISVCAGCDWREVRNLNNSLGLDMEIMMGKNILRPEWGVWEYPTIFLVSPNNRVLDKWEGEIQKNVVVEEVETFWEKELANRSRESRRDRVSLPSCTDGICY